jgi:hypothetical protein
MNKLELVDTLREETGINKSEATVIVNMFFDEMANALAKGDRVEIRGLCSFFIKKYKSYSKYCCNHCYYLKKEEGNEKHFYGTNSSGRHFIFQYIRSRSDKHRYKSEIKGC